MSLWPRVSKSDPCPICQRPDWCSFGDKAVKCMRVPSANPSHDGGYYHFFDVLAPRPEFVPRFKPPTSTINASALMERYRAKTISGARRAFAEGLGVSDSSMEMLGVAWCVEKNAWAFPMSDAEGKTIGIRLRSATGFKWAVPGSKQGIFLPDMSSNSGIAYLPEGPTNTAAFLTLGLFAIGRPNNMAGNELVRARLKALGVNRAVIVVDNDELKQFNGGEARPGIEGAKKLKRELGIPSVFYTPPTKDVRDFVKLGGTAAMIQADIKDKVWTTK